MVGTVALPVFGLDETLFVGYARFIQEIADDVDVESRFRRDDWLALRRLPGDEMAELSRILTSGGLVAGSTGLVVYGMGAAFVEPRDFELTIGMVLMVVGVVATVIGIGMSKRIQEEE